MIDEVFGLTRDGLTEIRRCYITMDVRSMLLHTSLGFRAFFSYGF